MTRLSFIIGVAAILLGGGIFMLVRDKAPEIALDSGAFRFAASVPLSITEEKVSREKKNSDESIVAIPVTYESASQGIFGDEVVGEVSNPPKEEQNSESEEKAIFQKSDPVCAFESLQSPLRSRVIINEVAWMGGLKSTNDEWLEFRNVTNSAISLVGWELVDEGAVIKVVFGDGEAIEAQGFYLLERTNDDAVSAVADTIYTGALGNSNEGLHLFSNSCVLEDEAMAKPDWVAGDSETRKTMERDESGFGWHTSLYVGGTPKAKNSEIPPPEPASLPPPPQNEPVVVEPPPPAEPPPPPPADVPVSPPPVEEDEVEEDLAPLLISEVQITGGSGKTTNDFIELYNPNDQAINLKGYRLVKRTANAETDTLLKSWTADALIPAQGFYLWANSDYVDIALAPDVTTSGTIADSNGIALRFGPNDEGEIIDTLAWGEVANGFGEGAFLPGGLTAFQSYERKANGCVSATSGSGNGCDTNVNAPDFEVRNISEPQNSGSVSET